MRDKLVHSEKLEDDDRLTLFEQSTPFDLICDLERWKDYITRNVGICKFVC